MLILITGVSRGLGRALATGFMDRGHTVYGCGRDPAAMATLAAEYPRPHRFDIVDVSRDDQVAAWAQSCLAEGEAPDLLINNAALINRNASLWRIAAADFDAVIDVNVKGVANVIRHFLPAMVARGHGVVVNFSSGWGRETDPEVAPYCASKWAVEGLTKALAQELPRGMAAVPVSPGIIDTDMLRSCFGTQAAAYPDATEWARAAVPWLLGLGRHDNGRSLTVGDLH
ncbi:SDR family oxidoreductase [Parasulfuritortus cantonensis]|uniref:SDR family oxidoreductase n=1 Tax=Parasulfuritortus cantonensis TaxID=2528202 RepID=A0A4R1BQH9_9PROT|nr:SDR family oxidoreductase [Parasulfuritortus cantonensis]TCJ19516.1 SDR family oxidoreductase [Parasulfuritortus cantonensis]